MLPSITALLLATVVTVAYLVLTEHLDYTSVRRRQLDAWAAAAAIGCLGLILYGNVSVRRTAQHDEESIPDATLEQAVPVGRKTPVHLEVPPDAAAPAPRLIVVAPPPADAAVPESPPPAADAQGPSREQVNGPVLDHPPLVRLPGEPTLQPTLAADPSVPTLTPVPGTTVQPWVPATATPAPPATSTALPTPEPRATPHCGDPADIKMSVVNLHSDREDVGGELVVDYSFDIRNDSAFPVSVVQGFVTVTRAQGGSETYGTQSMADVTIEAGAVFPVARRIPLDTRPPPFGDVRICVNFWMETCGQRRELDRGGQCQQVTGF